MDSSRSRTGVLLGRDGARPKAESSQILSKAREALLLSTSCGGCGSRHRPPAAARAALPVAELKL